MKIDRYILRGVWQALNCLSIHATYCVIVAGVSPWETKMWAAVRENGDFFTFVDHVKTNKHMFDFFSPSGSHTILVYRSYTDTKHRAAFLRQQSFLYTDMRLRSKPEWMSVCWTASDTDVCSIHLRCSVVKQRKSKLSGQFAMSFLTTFTAVADRGISAG